MGTIGQLPLSFKYPMPYYVASAHASMSVHCSTQHREDGGDTCYVLLPHGEVALQWLENVNGTCGEEYKVLRRCVELLWSESWQGASEKLRQRLGTWFDFEPGERFAHYFNDGEFGIKDEGLAGVVLTDRRLIYHKYHRKGWIYFSDKGKVTMRPDGEFAGMTLLTEEGNVKVAKIRYNDLELLVDQMRAAGLEVDLHK